jgi:hypothetical protein
VRCRVPHRRSLLRWRLRRRTSSQRAPAPQNALLRWCLACRWGPDLTPIHGSAQLTQLCNSILLTSYVCSNQLASARWLMQAGQQAAAAEAWCANAAAWAERLSSSYPGYRDLTQPVALAVHEARRGFATLAAAADMSTPHGRSGAMVRHTDVGSGSGEEAARLEGILRALMAFPAALRAQDGPAAVELASSGAQGLVSRLAAASAVRNQHLLSRATYFAPEGD